ncbi:MAG: UbiD family decarboxylase, partial [SAR202 cluster bacterium]|nr:UbiD family decarboxylase [SAR202 cluster bacterium]
MNFKDIREFIEFLDDRGDLKRVATQVDTELEITEITDRTIKSGGPALLFENVAGSDTPLAINLLGTHQRTAWALGVENIDDLTARVRKMLSLAQGPPTGLMGKVRALGDLVSVARTQPKIVRRAPCQDVVITGDEVNLNILPALKCWPDDAGRYITLPLVVSRDPESGRRNVGIYRMQIF